MDHSISDANGSQNLKKFMSANVFVGVQNFRSISARTLASAPP